MTEERILVCDDDDDVRAVLALSLEAVGGFRVVQARSGKEALALYPSSTPDLVVLDVMMPDLDGPSTLERLRRLPGGRRARVVFLSARSEPAEVARLQRLGVDDVLEKPFDPMTLPDRLRAILERRSA
ncbi:MAG TPA: response regulator [Planctomycetota bacterium]|nr:response regulator [Planctomycetota bacterium]